MLLRTALVGVAVAFSCTNAFAHRNPPADYQNVGVEDPQENVHTAGSRFTAKVTMKVANIFNFSTDDFKGSGFIYEFRKNEKGEDVGVVFTNAHVVKRNSHLDVREVKLEFQTDTRIAESVPAKVVYESKYEDFSVIEFKLNDLKRVKNRIRAAKTPQPGSPYLDFTNNYREAFHGLNVAVIGSPLESDMAMTDGIINTIAKDLKQGDLIQTQTPINAGNSGGPMVVYEEDGRLGEVIGLGVMKFTGEDVDNVGFAIPIENLIEEYKAWRKNPEKVAGIKDTPIVWAVVKDDELETLPIKEPILAAYPEYFYHNDVPLKIEDAAPWTNLKMGDIMVTVNGRMASTMFEFDRAVYLGDSPVHMEVVRGGKLIKVDVPYEDITKKVRGRQNDFVYFSGMLFQDTPRNFFNAHEVSTATYALGVNASDLPLNMIAAPMVKALIVGVEINGQQYKVTKVADLKDALVQNKGAHNLRLYVREPIFQKTEDGISITTDVFGQPIHTPVTSSFVLPLMDLVLPDQFSMKEFAKRVRFGAPNETQVWRRQVGVCVEELTKKTSSKKKN